VNQSWPCGYCGAGFDTLSAVALHEQREHGAAPVPKLGSRRSVRDPEPYIAWESSRRRDEGKQ